MPRWPTDGKITDTNLRVPISFTNSLGDFITDAIPTRLFANKLIYITAEGGGGTIRLEKLPPDLRERFGYDPEKAAQADEVDRQKHEAQLKRNKEAAYAAALAEYRQQIESSKMMIEGKVIQKLDIGLLVDSGTEIKRKSYEWAASVGAPTSGGEVKLFDPTTHLQIYNGLCLLTDYSKISSVVDGDIVRAVAYPNGEYSYTAVSGGSKTVRQFTCDINAVSKAPSQAELNQLKAWKPNEP
jgi:hypothetical protein